MVASYTPATKEQMAQMNDEQLLSQYQSLVDLIKETRGIPFERTPQRSGKELAELIWEGQINYIPLNKMVASTLEQWGERTGRSDQILISTGGKK